MTEDPRRDSRDNRVILALRAELAVAEAALDRVLAAPNGDRCHNLDGTLGSPGFARCGSCLIGPHLACEVCAAGGRAGHACRDDRRGTVCRGVAYLAWRRVALMDADGRAAEAEEVRTDMGLRTSP